MFQSERVSYKRKPFSWCSTIYPKANYAFREIFAIVTSNTRWFILERTETLRNVMIRAPVDMTRLDKCFKIYPGELIYAMGTVKIRQKTLPDGSVCLHNLSIVRAFYHVILIQVLNYCGLVYDSIVLMKSFFCLRRRAGCLNLFQNRTIRWIRQHKPYACPLRHTHRRRRIFQKHILSKLVSAIIAARGISTDVVSSAREAHINMIKPTIGIHRRIVQVGHQVCLSDVVKINYRQNRQCNYVAWL